jgi:hypothetical protein
MSGDHAPGCYMAVDVRFARPRAEPIPGVLASAAVTAIVNDCKRSGGSPAAAISLAIGPGRVIAELYRKVVADGHAESPATTARQDQLEATFAAEPDRFAALAFAHVIPVPR